MKDYSGKKRVLIITTGGTIAGNSADTNANKDTSGEQIKQDIELVRTEYGKECQIDFLDLFNKDSAEITVEDWLKIAKALKDNYANYDSFVIPHGTNTMQRTAFALSCMLPFFEKPIILTGSQHARNRSATDATLNLPNALWLALSDSGIKGPVVVFGENIVSGLNVVKVDNLEIPAFLPFGDNNTLGESHSGNIMIDPYVLLAHNKNFGKVEDEKEVQIYTSFITKGILPLLATTDLDSGLIFSLLDSNSLTALSLTCSGDADPNIQELQPVLKRLQEKEIPVLIIGESTNSPTTLDGLNIPGKIAREEYNAIPAGDLNGISAIIKLQWLLGLGIPYKNLKEAMLMSPKNVIKTFVLKDYSREPEDYLDTKEFITALARDDTSKILSFVCEYLKAIGGPISRNDIAELDKKFSLTPDEVAKIGYFFNNQIDHNKTRD